ncbi:MAG TPA: methyltransferase domain-containing protein [Burkholderiales bacterium]
MSLIGQLFRRRQSGAEPTPAPPASADGRSSIYDDLHHHQLLEQEHANQYSARTILSDLFSRFRPASVLDVGCGIGTWLATARDLGVPDVFGIEGEWLDRKLAKIPAERIVARDLEKGFDLGRRFDLAICLEVAEHLSADAAARFVESLAAHADVVLFSAAIPFQGGHHHVNEQFPEYWAERFGHLGFLPFDFLRSAIWNNQSVLWWLRQNVLVFAKAHLAGAGGPFAGLAAPGPLSIVHPEVYLSRVGSLRAVAAEHEKVMAVLSSGGSISVERGPAGELKITARR